MAAVMIGNLLVEVVVSLDGPRLRIQGPIYGVETPVTPEDLGNLASYLGRETDNPTKKES